MINDNQPPSRRLNPVLTPRLILRAPLESDLPALYEIHADPRTNRHNPAGPLGSLDEARQALQAGQAHWQAHGFGYWAACLQSAPERAIGFGGLRWRELEDEQRLNLYFRFRPESWGQGYATELGRAALAAAWEALAALAVYATTRPDNLASIRTLERLGLRRLAELQDVYGLSLLYRIERP